MSEADLSYQRYRAEDRSLGEIASDVLGNASTLVRQEIALAKAEVTESAKRASKGTAFYVGAGVLGLLALIALTIAMCWGFGALTSSMVWGSLITMVIWIILAVVLFFVGKNEFDKIRGLEQTQETISKIPNAAMGNEEKNQ